MPAYLFVLQVVVPVVGLIWLAAAPPAAPGARLALAVATGIVLLTLALVTPWAFPPFWVPAVYGIVWAALSLRLIRRASGRSGALAWLALVPAVGLAVYGCWLLPSAIGGRLLPAGLRVVDLDLPFGPGHYLTVNGGTTPTLNGHMHVLSDGDETDIGQAYAADFVGITALGLRSGGWQPADPARYVGFGRDVRAPCAGTVTSVHDGRPDMPVPQVDTDEPGGNGVALLCGEVAVVLAHLRAGSVAVTPGQTVEAGAVLGQVGNSGNSDEPHLHVHAELPDPAGGRAVPIAIRFDGRIPFRNSRFTVAGAG